MDRHAAVGLRRTGAARQTRQRLRHCRQSVAKPRQAGGSQHRILDLFVRTNLANRIESANAYLVNTHPGCRHDCIFLICDDCGKATHIDDERVSGALREAGRDAGFTDVRPVVELRGLCDDCAS